MTGFRKKDLVKPVFYAEITVMSGKICALFLSMLLCLSGCMASPGKIGFDSVFIVDSQSEEPFSKQWLELRNFTLLKINFSSESNFKEFSKQKRATMSNEVKICEKDENIEFFFLDVYWNHRLFDHDVQEEKLNYEIYKQNNNSFIYNTYVSPVMMSQKGLTNQLEDINNKKIKIEDFYNFWDKPEDICLRIVGGNNNFATFSTNWIVIPKEAIKTALDAYRRRHPDYMPPAPPIVFGW